MPIWIKWAFYSHNPASECLHFMLKVEPSRFTNWQVAQRAEQNPPLLGYRGPGITQFLGQKHLSLKVSGRTQFVSACGIHEILTSCVYPVPRTTGSLQFPWRWAEECDLKLQRSTVGQAAGWDDLNDINIYICLKGLFLCTQCHDRASPTCSSRMALTPVTKSFICQRRGFLQFVGTCLLLKPSILSFSDSLR